MREKEKVCVSVREKVIERDGGVVHRYIDLRLSSNSEVNGRFWRLDSCG